MTWSVPRIWPGETCFILAGGPSLEDFDPDILCNRRVITINDSWRLAPWAPVKYFADAEWWHAQELSNVSDVFGEDHFRDEKHYGLWVTGAPEFDDHPVIRYLRLTGQEGLETDPTGLRHGNNSGYAAINLAYHLRVRRIILLGYDMHTHSGRTHWHDEPRPDGFARILDESMLPMFDSLVEPLRAADVEVLNCTLGSALTCWPYRPLEEILSEPAAITA